MKIEILLERVVKEGASDGFIAAGAPPSIKVDGKIFPITDDAVSEEEARELVLSTMREDQQDDFLKHHECNYALSYEDLGRFRASAFVQRGKCGLVVRRIKTDIPTIDELGLPPIIKELAMTKRGLVIFVGATGTGKSTSLAAMVGYRNQNSRGHIISIEDPIEYIHDHGNCIVTQREVGMDTESFDVALKNTLRQAPDVIMIGEVRSAETMAQALTFAETGHLCLCTLHANNANQALDRIQSFFPAEMHDQVWMDLSLNLKSMVAQQLIAAQGWQGPGARGGGTAELATGGGLYSQGRGAPDQGPDGEIHRAGYADPGPVAGRGLQGGRYQQGRRCALCRFCQRCAPADQNVRENNARRRKSGGDELGLSFETPTTRQVRKALALLPSRCASQVCSTSSAAWLSMGSRL